MFKFRDYRAWTTALGKMKGVAIAIVLVAVGLGVIISQEFPLRESGHGFVAGDWLVLGEYGYSDDGDRLRYAIFRTWPKDSTPEQRMLDRRRAMDFRGWALIRDHDGLMIPVGTNGDVYFFEGDKLKTMKVRMNEHTDTMPLDNLKSLDEVWAYLQRFQVD